MKYKLVPIRILGAAAALAISLTGGRADAANSKPDIVIISAKEFAGSKSTATPDLDLLFSNSATFVNGYASAPLAGPANAAILTGRPPARFGFDANVEENTNPSDHVPRGLDLTQVTLATRLKTAGYVTGAFGEWYLGAEDGYLPTQRGFDEFFGTVSQARRSSLFRGGKLEEISDIAPAHFERFESESLAFIDHHAGGPLFLYLPVTGEPAQIDDLVKQVTGRLQERHADGKSLVIFVNHHTEQWNLSDKTLHSDIAIHRLDQTLRGHPFKQVVSDIDIAPTALAAAGIEVKADWKIEGGNLLPLLDQSEDVSVGETLYWRFGVQNAVRQGDWKLVKASARAAPKLFNLANDPKESHDLSNEQPAKVSELQSLRDAWNTQNQQPHWVDEHWNGSSADGEEEEQAPAKSANLTGPWASGDSLRGKQTPRIVGRSLDISADLEVTGKNGVVVSLGGNRQGLAVYLKEGKLAFAVRENGQLTAITAAQPIGTGHFAVQATLSKDGTLALLVDGKKVADGKAAGPIPQQPKAGLSVGEGTFGAVGEYESPSPFGGKVSNLQIKAEEGK